MHKHHRVFLCGKMEKDNFKVNQNFENRKQDKKAGDYKKKPFDKKKYRDQKYNKKFQVKKWEEQRKKAALRHLNKELKKENIQDFKYPNDEASSDQEHNSDDTNKKPKVPFFSAKREFLKKKREKLKQKEEFLRQQQEREEALKKYKEKKMRTYKQLSQKTWKGQPVMKGRMELLLEKIQKST